MEEFFNYILIFRGGSGDEKERDTILLNKYIKDIERNRVFEEMETYLEIGKR